MFSLIIIIKKNFYGFFILKYITHHTSTLQFPKHFDSINNSNISVVEVAQSSKGERR